jgi:cysteine desulfurase
VSIYFDHAATTPISDSALTALTNQAKKLGNASSLHSAGRSVRKDLEAAREEIAKAIDCAPSEVIFTATGTEANNLAIKGLYWKAIKEGKNLIITSTFEHHAVMDPILWLAEHEGAKVIEIDVDKSGMVDLDRLKQVVIDNKGKIYLNYAFK